MDDMSFLDPKTLALVIAAIRKSFNMNSMELQLALYKGKSAEVGPRGGSRYICNHCKHLFGRGEIFVDHLMPVVSVDTEMSKMSLQQYYMRCFTTVENLQLLCAVCHSMKTKNENIKRREFKKLTKKLVTTKLKVA